MIILPDSVGNTRRDSVIFKIFLVLSPIDLESFKLANRNVGEFLFSSILETLSEKCRKEEGEAGMYIEERKTPMFEENRVYVLKVFNPSKQLAKEIYGAIINLVG